MDIDTYLTRINYSGSRAPVKETLQQLHYAHMLTVPFENLDIHLGRPIVLDEEKFYEKIVQRMRGGFCYELNGLFAALLRALGFNVTMLSARVHDNGKPGPEFDHMALLIQLEERWIADVGFGDSFIEPLLLDDPGEQIQRNVAYRIEPQGNIWKVQERKSGDESKIMYEFTLQPRKLQDYAEVCRYHQTSPQSHFTQKRICTLATANGRVTLSDMKLIRTENGIRNEQIISTNEEYSGVLKAHFGFTI